MVYSNTFRLLTGSVMSRKLGQHDMLSHLTETCGTISEQIRPHEIEFRSIKSEEYISYAVTFTMHLVVQLTWGIQIAN